MNNVTSNCIIPFNYNETAIRVIKDETGNPWFIAKDVFNILDIVWKGSDSLGPLDEDEKGVLSADTLGGKQSFVIISESGLYVLAFKSNKPEAKKFRKWVTSEVLPAIRKTGSYSTPGSYSQPNLNPKDLQSITKNLLNFKKMALATGLTGKAAVNSANESMIKFYGVDCLELIGHPSTKEPTTTLGSISNFIADCCLVDLNNHKLRVAPSELYRQYVKYSHDLGVAALISREFNAFVMTKFTRVKSNGIRRYRGIGLLQEGI